MNMIDHGFMSQTPQRQLPENLEAEQALLGALLVNSDNMLAVPGSFRADHFHEKIHREIFSEIKRQTDQGKKTNPVLVKQALPVDGRVGDMTVAQYLARLAREAVNAVSIPSYAQAISFDAVRRGLINVGTHAEDIGYEEKDEVTFLEEIDALKSQLHSLTAALEEEGLSTLADAAERALDATSEAYQGKGVVGVDYGFAPLMNMIGPAMPGQLIVVGGGTKQGKSSLLEQIIMGAAVNGHPVWVYSGEMKGEELAQRALSRITDIQAWRQARGKVSDAEYQKLDAARRNAETWQRRIILKDKPMTMAQIERSVEQFAKRHPEGMAVVDHIGLVERDKETARLEEQQFGPHITRATKLLASKAGLPIFAAAQLKKNTFVSDKRQHDRKSYMEATNRRPRYTDLIGAVERDANHVITPFRAEPILEELRPSEGTPEYMIWEDVMETVKNKAEIILALSRHTRWPQRREVGWNGGRTMFEDRSQTSQERFI